MHGAEGLTGAPSDHSSQELHPLLSPAYREAPGGEVACPATQLLRNRREIFNAESRLQATSFSPGGFCERIKL